MLLSLSAFAPAHMCGFEGIKQKHWRRDKRKLAAEQQGSHFQTVIRDEQPTALKPSHTQSR